MDGGTRGPGLTWRSAVIALGTVMTATLAGPAGAVEPGGRTLQAPVSPVPTAVSVRADHIDGLDEVAASAGSYGPHVDGVWSSAWVCVSAERSHVGTASDGGRETKVVEAESGCLHDLTTYRFDTLSWHAAAHGTVPTHLTISTYEKDADGWEVVDVRESTASATVDLAWYGVGEQRLAHWVTLPFICYAMPPTGPVCWNAGLAVHRDADVVGSVEFSGLGVAVELPVEQLGVMRWWAGR